MRIMMMQTSRVDPMRHRASFRPVTLRRVIFPLVAAAAGMLAAFATPALATPTRTCVPGDHADCRGVDLRYRDLHGLSLRKADLRDAHLRFADLRGTRTGRVRASRSHKEMGAVAGCPSPTFSVQVASFVGADLQGANLSNADDPLTNFAGANLSGANLTGMDLSGINFSNTDLDGAQMANVNLSGVSRRACRNTRRGSVTPRSVPHSEEFPHVA